MLICLTWGCVSCWAGSEGFDSKAQSSSMGGTIQEKKESDKKTKDEGDELSEKSGNLPNSEDSSVSPVKEETQKSENKKSSEETPVAVVPPVEKNAASEDKTIAESGKDSADIASQGIRFSFQDVPKDMESGVYLSKPSENDFWVKPMIGLFSPTLPFPEDGVVKLYDSKAKPDSEPILTAKIPEGLGKEILAIIVPFKDGRKELVFLDKNSIKGEKFFIKNVSGTLLGIQMGSQDMVELANGAEYFFTPTVKNEKGIYAGRLKLKGKKGDWYSSKTFAFRARETLFEVILIIHNAEFGKPDIQKFIFTEQSV